MFHIKTLLYAFLFLTTLTSAWATAPADGSVGKKHLSTKAVSSLVKLRQAAAYDAYSACLQDKMIKAEIPAGMQNTYNPNTYVGKLFLQFKADCASLKVGNIHPAVEHIQYEDDEGGGVSERAG